MALQRNNEVKVSALLREGHKVSEVINLVGVSCTQLSTRSRNAWAMAKVSPDEQVVVKRLLWIVTVYGMSFDGLSNGISHFASRTNKCRNY